MRKFSYCLYVFLCFHPSSTGAGVLSTLGSFIAGGVGGFLGGRAGSKTERPVVYNIKRSSVSTKALENKIGALSLGMMGMNHDIMSMNRDIRSMNHNLSIQLGVISLNLNNIIGQNKQTQDMIVENLNAVKTVEQKIDLLAGEIEASSRKQDIRDLANEMIISVETGPRSFDMFLAEKFSQLENTKDLYDFKRLEENLLIVSSQMFRTMLSDSKKPDILKSQNTALEYAEKIQERLSSLVNFNTETFSHKKNLGEMNLSISDAKIHLYKQRIQTVDDTIPDTLALMSSDDLTKEQEVLTKDIQKMVRRNKRGPMKDSGFRVLMVNYLEGDENDKFSLSFEILEKLKGDQSSQAEKIRRLVMINLAKLKNSLQTPLESEEKKAEDIQKHIEKEIFCEQKKNDIKKQFTPRLLDLYGRLALEKLAYAFLKAGNKHTSSIEGFIAKSIAKIEDVDNVRTLENQLKKAFEEQNGSNQTLYSVVGAIIDGQIKNEVNNKYRLNNNDAKVISLMAMIEQESPSNKVYGLVNLVWLAQESTLPMKNAKEMEKTIDNTFEQVKQIQEEMLSAFRECSSSVDEKTEAVSISSNCPSDLALCQSENTKFLSLDQFINNMSELPSAPNVNHSTLSISEEEFEKRKKRLLAEREHEWGRKKRSLDELMSRHANSPSSCVRSYHSLSSYCYEKHRNVNALRHRISNTYRYCFQDGTLSPATKRFDMFRDGRWSSNATRFYPRRVLNTISRRVGRCIEETWK